MKIRFTLLVLLALSIKSIAQTSVYFDLDSYRLSPDAELLIDSLLTTDPASLDVSCHCDQSGSDAYNWILSQERAVSVRNYLMDKGIKKGLISLSFFGETRPVYAESSEFVFKNRRCEISTPARQQNKEVRGFFQSFEPKKNQSYTLPGMKFVGNQAIPEPESFFVLEYLLAYMQFNPKSHFQLEGHVCCINNKELSEFRAKIIYDFLVWKGVPRNRISYKGYGNTRPLEKEVDDESKAKNRRVAIRVMRKGELPKKNPNLIPARVDSFRFPVYGVDFYPNRDYLNPNGEHNLKLVAKSMKGNTKKFYSFIVYEQRGRKKVLEGRVESMRKLLLNQGVSEDMFSVSAADIGSPGVGRGKDFILLIIHNPIQK